MENEKSNVKKKPAGLIFLIVVIAILVGIVVGALIGRQIKSHRDYVADQKFKTAQKEVLKEELEKILVMDPIVDDVDQTIHTEKDYAMIEKAMKAYFTDFFSVVKSVNEFSKDDRFTILMDQDQMIADAPDFTSTLQAIDTLKTEYTADAEALSELMTNDKIDSYLDQSLEEEYVNIYHEMMTSGSTVTVESELQTEVSNSKNQIMGVLDKYKVMIDYLVANKDGWELEGTTFMFHDQSALDQYNSYVDDFTNVEKTIDT